MSVTSHPAKRWLKRWSRRLVAGAGRTTRWAGRAQPSGALRILTYHRIDEDPRDPFAVSPAAFRKQMATLSSSGFVTPMGEALERLDLGDSSAPRIVLTFDDGTRDFLTEALPVLRDFNLPATLYVSPLRVGGEGFLDWSELKDIREAGVAVESHGLDHRSLGGLTPEELWRQVDESRRMIEERLSHPVSSIAYPYGTLRDFDAKVKESVQRAGYKSGCSSMNGLNRSGADRFELRRTKIEQGDLPIFSWIITGCLDGWALVDRHLAGLQNRYT